VSFQENLTSDPSAVTIGWIRKTERRRRHAPRSTTQEGIAPMQNEPIKRHIPVEGHSGFYWKDSRKLEIGFRFRDSDGRRQYAYGSQAQFGGRPWTSVREAKTAQAHSTVERDRQERVFTAKARTFGEVREDWVATRKVADKTAEERDRCLRNYAQDLERRKLRDIDERAILRWLNGLCSVKTGGELAEGTKGQILAAVSDVFRHGVKCKDIPRNVVRELDRDDKPHQGEGRRRILTHDEEDRLYLYSANFSWLRDVVTVARAQALRIGEVVGLDWEAVDFANNKLRVYQQYRRNRTLGATKGANPRKGRRDRRDVTPIDLMPEAREALLRLRLDHSTGPVFRNANGERMHQRQIDRAFRKAVSYAALPVTEDGPVSLHSLRHTQISRLANDRRIPLVAVRDFAGHQSLETTETYVHKIENPDVVTAMAEASAG
jgi:integrase